MQRRIASDLLKYLPAKVLPALTAFITVPIFTRLFSPDEYGSYVLAFGLSELLLAGACTGLATGAIRFYTQYRLKSSLSSYFAATFGSLSIATLGVMGAVAVALVLLRPIIQPDLYPLLWAALVAFFLNSWFVTLMYILRAQEKVGWYSAFELLNRYGAVIFGLVLVLSLGMRAEGLIWGQSVALLVALLPLLMITTRGILPRLGDIRWSGLRELWAYAWPLSVGNVAGWGIRLADRFVIEAFRGSFEVGLYSVSYNISARSIDLIVALFLLVPTPIMMRLWEEQGRTATESALTSITRAYLILIVPAVVGLSAIALPLVGLLADQPYLEGYHAIWLVAASSMAYGLSLLGSYGTLLSNRTKAIARNQLLATGASLLLNLILVPLLGFMGAAISACASFALLAYLQASASSPYLTWRWPLGSLLRVGLATAAMAGAVTATEAAVGAETTLAQAAVVLLAVGVGGAVYLAALLALGEISPSTLLALRSLGRRTPAAPTPVEPVESTVLR